MSSQSRLWALPICCQTLRIWCIYGHMPIYTRPARVITLMAGSVSLMRLHLRQRMNPIELFALRGIRKQ